MNASSFQIAVALGEVSSLTWFHLFGNDNPVELEIGTGKAAFLLRRARALPDRNFLGIEWANQFYRFAADRMERWGVPNVRMLRTDASAFVRLECPRGSLAALHIYHPDPWPKKRHHKRRLFQPAFVDAAVACLVPSGRIAVQTDHAEYFGIISALLQANPQLQPAEFFDPAWSEGWVNEGAQAEGVSRVATNFENKYRQEGRTIYQAAAVRRLVGQ